MAITSGVLLWACSGETEQKTSVLDEAAVAVQVHPVEETSYSTPIVTSGLISSGTESTLSFKVGGVISSIRVEEGQSVNKGQMLASLDLTEIEAQVAQARNNVEKTKRDIERGQRLFKDSAATLEQIQNLQTAYDLAGEGYRIATFNREYATIKATTNGKVLRKFVNEGELVAPGSPILIVNAAGENDWIIRTGLADVDWVRVKPADVATIQLDAHPGIDFDGRVSLINEGADPVTGLYTIEVKIDTKGRKFATGLVGHVAIRPASQNVLKSVPIEAIVEGTGHDAFVFVVNDDGKSVRRVGVHVAQITNNVALISAGLDSIEKVITSGSAFLSETSTVTIMN